MSDLHLELDSEAGSLIWPPGDDIDLIIFAGDIHNGASALSWMADYAEGREVIYVAGNHEFYGHTFPTLIDDVRNATAQYPNIHLLEQGCFVHKGVYYLGCTLWTDFELFGTMEWSMYECERLPDFSSILQGDGVLKPSRIRQYHRDSLIWLGGQLELYRQQPCVVISHHLPAWDAVPSRYYNDVMTPAFASELTDFILRFSPDYWLCGHTHDRVDLQVGNTRVLAAPMGYVHENNYPGGYEGLIVPDL